MVISDFALWHKPGRKTNERIVNMSEIKVMNEVQCYNRLYNGMANIVPHYKNRVWKNVVIVRDKAGNDVLYLDGQVCNSGEFTVSFYTKEK